MSVDWNTGHWGDATHHAIVHTSETGSDVADAHTEKVDD